MTGTKGFSQNQLYLSAYTLVPRTFSELAGFDDDNLLEAWNAFVQSCHLVALATKELRIGMKPNDEFRSLCQEALTAVFTDIKQVHRFFTSRFQPYEIVPTQPVKEINCAFLTGYYEPIVVGSKDRTPEYVAPILSRPDDLITLDSSINYSGLPAGVAAARRRDDGILELYPTRKEIDAGVVSDRTKPIIWVRDWVEAYMIHVQGSAAILLPNGDLVRLTYAGRNGHPYTSIGKVLVDTGEISIEQMALSRLKQWIRDNGQGPGDKGRALLHQNASYVFFTIDESPLRTQGPIGAQGVPLSPLRSLAIDRGIWSYGLPFWIEADLPWVQSGGAKTRFRRLMIAQDTGSAIVGPARADIFFGSGDEAGVFAGGIRQFGRMVVLLPKSSSDIDNP